MLDGDLAFCRQLFDFVLSVLFPILDVWVHADAEGTALEQQPVSTLPKGEGRKEAYRKDEGPDVVLEAGGPHGLLVRLWRVSLIAQNEASADPDGACAEHQCRGQALAVEDTAGSDDLNFLAREWALLARDQLLDRRDEDACWDITTKSQLRTPPKSAAGRLYPV